MVGLIGLVLQLLVAALNIAVVCCIGRILFLGTNWTWAAVLNDVGRPISGYLEDRCDDIANYFRWSLAARWNPWAALALAMLTRSLAVALFYAVT